MNTFIVILKGNTLDISKIFDNNMTTKGENDKLGHNTIIILISINILEFRILGFYKILNSLFLPNIMKCFNRLRL